MPNLILAMRTTFALLIASCLPLLSSCSFDHGLGLGLVSPLVLMFFGLIVGVLYVVALVDIFRSTRLASEKAIFIVLIFSIPIIGILAYFALRGQE